MRYLLDSNTIVYGLNQHPAVRARLLDLEPETLLLCAPVLAELTFGVANSSRLEENGRRLEALVQRLRFVAFSASAARRFGFMKAGLRKRGIQKSDFDLAIAAIAIDVGATLVSGDRAFFDGTLEGSGLNVGCPGRGVKEHERSRTLRKETLIRLSRVFAKGSSTTGRRDES